MKAWRDAVIDGINRLTKHKNSYFFSRQEIISQELDLIVRETESEGETPSQTLSRILQELRNDNLIDFIDNQGNYIYLGKKVNIEDEEFTIPALDAAIYARKLSFRDIETSETIALRRQRVGQNRLRYWTLFNYHHQCALCDVKDKNLLVAAHLARWADYHEGRGDLQNIVCLCRLHDPLLEYGYISLTDDYKILKKHTNSKFINYVLDNTNRYREPENMPLNSQYLSLHRRRSGF